MELFIKKYGTLPIARVFNTKSTLKYIQTMVNGCEKSKIVSVKQLFNLIFADEISWMPTDLLTKIRNPIFMKDWMKEIELGGGITIKQEEEKIVFKDEPQYQKMEPLLHSINDENYLTASGLTHLPTYGNHIPTANMSIVFRRAFEQLGFVFLNDSDFHLLWNIILLFVDIQVTILNLFQIEPIPNQTRAPKGVLNFGSLSDFLSMDGLTKKLKKKWSEPLGEEFGFYFNARPWKFSINSTIFEENECNAHISLFETLLTFAMGFEEKKNLLQLQKIELFQWEKTHQPKTIVLLCYDLILSVLVGKQIKLHPKYHPILFQSFHCSKVPKLTRYFLGLNSFRHTSISIEYFKTTEMFGEIIPDVLAHPFSKKTFLFIQKQSKNMDDDEYKLLIFPKQNSEKSMYCFSPEKSFNSNFQRPEAYKNRIFSKTNTFFHQVCTIKDQTLVAINTPEGYLYRTLDLNHKTTSINICLLSTYDIKKMIDIAKIWFNGKTNLIFISQSLNSIDDESVCLYPDKITSKTKIIIANRKNQDEFKHVNIGLIFVFETYHLLTALEPYYGYIIVSTLARENELNWIAIQSMFMKANPFLKSHISFSQAIYDNCILYVNSDNNKSTFTQEREDQIKEELEYLKQLEMEKIVPVETIETVIRPRKRQCENSRLLKAF